MNNWKTPIEHQPGAPWRTPKRRIRPNWVAALVWLILLPAAWALVIFLVIAWGGK